MSHKQCLEEKATWEAAKLEKEQAQAAVNQLCMDLAAAQQVLMQSQAAENQAFMAYQNCLNS